MEKYVFSFIGGLVLYYFCVVCWHKLLNKKINYKDYKLYLAILVADIGSNIISFCAPQFMKFLCTLLILFVINHLFFNRNIAKSILTVLISEFIVVFSEFLVFILYTLLFGDNIPHIYNTGIGLFLLNFVIALVSFLFLKFKFIYKLFNYLLKTFDNMKRSNLIGYFVLTILLISLFLIMSYMKLPVSVLLICNTVLTILYLIILFRLANTREKYKSIHDKYETSLNSLREYESIMDKYRISNHENKNELLTIRNMIDKKDKKTAKYIDKLVDNKIKDNETIFYKTSKIPEGGLRAIIYSKLCKMEDEKINYELDIANDVKTANLLEIGDSTNLNICKIVGVFWIMRLRQ